MDTRRIPPAGDPFTSAGSLAHPSSEEDLAKLEETFRHELMGDEERLELQARIERIQRRLRFGLSR